VKLSPEAAALSGLLFLAASRRQIAKKIDDEVNALLDEHARELAHYPADLIAEARRRVDVNDRKYQWSQGWHQYRRDIMTCLRQLSTERAKRAAVLKSLERERVEEKIRNVTRELKYNPNNAQARESLLKWEAKLRQLPPV
jgi:hypothetical protein